MVATATIGRPTGCDGSPWLPQGRTRLFGRESEVARLIALLTDSPGHVVSLIGAGGCGKTRLAVEVVHRLAASLPDGCAFVSLADLHDPERLATEILRGLGVGDSPRVAPVEQVIAAVRGRRMLLVLDDFEHLVSAAPVTSYIAAQCPETAVLVTSRRRLNVRGERTLVLPPLPLPPADCAAAPSLADVPSVALFCERAAAASSQFTPSDTDLCHVAGICRAVDGLPLAIELVASHVRVLRPDVLLDRLRTADGTTSILGGGPADAPARQRSLPDTVRWSYDLLGRGAAGLLPRLAVFHDGWTLAAMEAVCGQDRAAGTLPFEALAELVDLHLVDPVEVCGSEPRFRLPETVRRFAMDTLRSSGGLDEALDRHARYFVDFALRTGRDLTGPGERAAARLVDLDLPNVRAALRHCLTHRPEDGLPAVNALGPYWLDWGLLREGREWFDGFLARPAGTARERAVARGWSVRLAIEQADPTIGGDDTGDRLVQARADVDPDSEAWLTLTIVLATWLRVHGHVDDADRILVEALAKPTLGDWERADLLYARTVVARDRGDEGAVADLAELTARTAQRVGHERIYARAMMQLAVCQPSMANARSEMERAYQLCHDYGDRRGAVMSAAVAGVVCFAENDAAGAAKWLLTCLDTGVAVGFWHGVAWGVMGSTALAIRGGHDVEAATLHGALRRQLDVIRRQTPRAQFERYACLVEALRDRLGERFEAECRRGEALGWPAAVELARRITSAVTAGADSAGALGAGRTVEDATAVTSTDSIAARRASRRRGPRANTELTDRELDVLRELVVGSTNRSIAERLGLSAKTVMHHTGSVYRKLGVRSRAEAVAHALREQLVAS